MTIEPETFVERFALLVIAAAIPVYLWAALRWNVNWDEFNFLAGIYAIQSGRETPGLNDFHSVIYGWLTSIPGSEIDQIIVARIFQLGFFAGAMGLLYLVAQTQCARPVALITVVLCITYTDLLRHATSFRFDTLCLFFSLLAVYLFHNRRSGASAALSGITLGVSALVSVKTIFYILPIALLGIYLIASKPDPLYQTRQFLLLAASSVGFLILILAWQSMAHSVDSQSVGKELIALQSAGVKMFLTEGLIPKANYLFRGMTQNVGHWLLIATGAILALATVAHDCEKRRVAVTALIFLLPLASVLVYRNAFPYFYVFVLPPALLSVGLALNKLFRTAEALAPRIRRLLVITPAIAGVVTAGQFLLLDTHRGTEDQQKVLKAVHAMFPDPVPYIGAHGMVASFPRQGFFMSTWGMQNYHQQSTPVFDGILKTEQPKFLLRNHPAFNSMGRAEPPTGNFYAWLLPEDQKILTENFIHHWGPINVAGKYISLPKPGNTVHFLIAITGPYTVEAAHKVIINERLLNPFDVIELNAGEHEIQSKTRQQVTLRWGRRLAIPESEPPSAWLYDGL